MFVVAISKIRSQVVEDLTTLVMMMMMVVVVVVMVMMMMVMMMYITIPSSHFPFRALSKMPSTLTNLVPSSSQKFYPQILPISVFFFFLAKFFCPIRLAVFIFTFANWQ